MLKTTRDISIIDIELRQLLDERLSEETQKLIGISEDMRLFDIIIRICNHIEHYDPPCQMCSMIDSLNNS